MEINGIKKGFFAGHFFRKGFTLVEVLVVISIISVLMGILLPAFSKVRSYARRVVSMNNQKQTASAVNLFAVDNDDKYPASVSFVEYSGNWNWYDPRTLASWSTTDQHPHRSVGAYLGGYIADASVMACPKSPSEFKYLQEAWDAGDDWNNPDTTFDVLALRGSYCYYWNYVGWLDGGKLFNGPKGPSAGRGESKLLASCYFGYDHRRALGAYGSCEIFKGGEVVAETTIDSSWWAYSAGSISDLSSVEIKLNAAYTDGHVESFVPSEGVVMKAIMNRFTNEPYPSGVGPGDFYVPRDALR